MISALQKWITKKFNKDELNPFVIDENVLRNSSLLARLETVAIEDPVDIDDTEEILRLLSEAACYLIPALDNNDIHFDNKHSEAALYQMLSTSYQLTRQPSQTQTRH